ncbi:LOW QUALITY PROTEIN: VQ motif-containing protein 4-like [Elaeis guineensis]|uniref:LOW QUALITY PROTEIN: VQ motif-containing protein 4-like n=1 Tax=Elaeis guineensis var. tenera TaxID=51953 RepID=UPI003C6D703A
MLCSSNSFPSLSSFLLFLTSTQLHPHPPSFIPPLLHLLITLTFFFAVLTPQPMENHHRNPQQKDNPPSHSTSPNTSTSSSSSSSNGAAATATATAAAAAAAQVPSPSIPQPPTPKSMPRSIESNPYPTTFIQADTSSFKQVVQMLTGSAETAAKHAAAAANPTPRNKNPIPPAVKATGPKKPAFKLYERRSGLKNLKMISPLIPTFLNSTPISPAGGSAFSPRKQPEILSPSMLDLPSLALSPVTPLIPDPFNRSPHPNSTPSSAMSAEERAIAEKGFYLHPSPRTTPRDAEPPRLLPLFPVTSPRISSSASSP